MTRDEVELACKNVRELGQLVWEADKLQANDAEQRAMIDEQVEENRGLRADVKLMQQANADQREEIRLLNEQVHAANQELLKRAEEITRLREALREIIEKCDDEDWEYMYGDIMQRAKQALTQEPT